MVTKTGFRHNCLWIPVVELSLRGENRLDLPDSHPQELPAGQAPRPGRAVRHQHLGAGPGHAGHQLPGLHGPLLQQPVQGAQDGGAVALEELPGGQPEAPEEPGPEGAVLAAEGGVAGGVQQGQRHILGLPPGAGGELATGHNSGQSWVEGRTCQGLMYQSLDLPQEGHRYTTL